MLATVRSLTRHPTRTALTVAGVAIGYGSYLVIVSSAVDLTRHLGARLAATGAEVAVRQAGIGGAILSRIRETDLPLIRSAACARSASGILVQSTRSPGGRQMPVIGFDPADPIAGLFSLRSGRWLLPGAREVVLGRSLAEKSGVRVGGRLEVLPGRGFTVVGVCDSGNAFIDSGCGLSLSEAQSLFGMDGLVNLVLVKLEEPSRVREAIEMIKTELPHLHATASELFFAGRKEMDLVKRWSSCLGLAVLVVSALSVASTVGRNVAEREGELAILRALGWSRVRIVAVLLAEGAVLAAAGGMAGSLGAFTFLHVAGAQGLSPWISPSLPFRVVLEGGALVALSVLLGTLIVLGPVLRIRPAAALRAP